MRTKSIIFDGEYPLNNAYNDFFKAEYPSLDQIIEYYSLSYLFEDKKEEIPSVKKFKVTKGSKHGRKIKKDFLGNKIHSSNSSDNILCKLHIHFLKFLVNFANDAIKTVLKHKERTKLEFKQIEHSIKVQISKKNLVILAKKPIGDVLQLDISKKYKKLSLDKDYNKNIFNQVIASSSWLKNLFDMNYIDAFELYYNNCQPIKLFEFEQKEIKFSKKTKSFFCLYEFETEEKKTKLKSTAENYYLKLGKTTDYKPELTTELKEIIN